MSTHPSSTPEERKDAGLLRRIDYSVDVLGGGPAVHYPAEYREFDGVMVPTRRRVRVRHPDGSPAGDSISIAVAVLLVRARRRTSVGEFTTSMRDMTQ